MTESAVLRGRALVIGASGGIGRAVADALQNRGAEVTGLSRSQDGLDLTDPRSVARAAQGLDGRFDLIFNATGGLEIGGIGPEKSLAQIEADAMAAQFALNAIGPALLMKHFHRLLPRDRASIFASLSARVGSIGDNRLGGWTSYRAAKAAQNQIIRTAAIEIARKWPKAAVVALHPGTVETPLTADYAARHPTVAPAEAASNLLAVIDGLQARDSGRFFAWDGSEIPW
ncbi:SDR family NAD(P)-dependent oxidoreductase [Oceanomicrobium pacificus]|uniref:SDR family NAD(P)-dependent oxidoreductase n=1 Tax=Oceanomicrobium pacificus TaxID=2692916 RepID=A0A6B0TTT7_9RHOB|nr:SDR family NAD(P)-dependent oxidoreductase [Oceanomicrobium pacificus]MXU64644.1 SDR family NAD(P)-dependent oxidoreductase [Oceanomicrobium pacificus]